MRTESNAYEAVRPQTVDLGRRARSLHVRGHVQMLRAREPLDDVLDVRCQLHHTLRNRERQMPELCEAALHLLYLQMQRHHYRQSRVSWLVFGGDGVTKHTYLWIRSSRRQAKRKPTDTKSVCTCGPESGWSPCVYVWYGFTSAPSIRFVSGLSDLCLPIDVRGLGKKHGALQANIRRLHHQSCEQLGISQRWHYWQDIMHRGTCNCVMHIII